MISAETVLDATGLLAEFNTAGVLRAADVHTARRIAELAGETEESVILALALTVRALSGGSVCIDPLTVHADVFETDAADAPGQSAEQTLATEDLPWPEPQQWLTDLTSSRLVTVDAGGVGERPLRLVGGKLYLERYWRQEDQVRRELQQRWIGEPQQVSATALRAGLDQLFTGQGLPPGVPDQQRLAAAMSVLGRVTVISGGPGTGKTRTVARILALLHTLSPRPPRIALAAPTGKAAARLESSVRGEATGLAVLGPPWDRVGRDVLDRLQATTLHRLLGAGYQTNRMRHHATNPLPHDILVVDEMSMVPLTMMSRLLDAVRPDARLILVGDPDQLTSVEAGAVLADITRAQPAAPVGMAEQVAAAAGRDPAEIVPGQVTLQHTWRFSGDSGIDRLAQAVRHGDADAALATLRSGAEGLLFTELDSPIADALATPQLQALRRRVIEAGRVLHEAARTPGEASTRRALEALDSHRVLCAHRGGPYGVSRWGRLIQSWLVEAIDGYGLDGDGEWYYGRPLMITRNDAEAGLYNGDTGVVVATPNGPRAAFARGTSIALHSPLQLDAAETVHAMTVHKSQGSQFRSLTLIVPPLDSPLLTRELFYTGVTRASDEVEVIGEAAAIVKAIQRPANRASGLRERL